MRIKYIKKIKTGNLMQDVAKTKHVSMVKYFKAFNGEKDIY